MKIKVSCTDNMHKTKRIHHNDINNENYRRPARCDKLGFNTADGIRFVGRDVFIAPRINKIEWLWIGHNNAFFTVVSG